MNSPNGLLNLVGIAFVSQSSTGHPVTTNVFFAEFPEYLESLLPCKERLLITGDSIT